MNINISKNIFLAICGAICYISVKPWVMFTLLRNTRKMIRNVISCMKGINRQKRFLRTEKVWPGLLAARWGELFLFERRGLLRGDTKTSLPSPDRFLETFDSLKETPYLVRTLMNSSFFPSSSGTNFFENL